MSRFLLREHIQNAVQSLRSTRTRTMLTTLGIAIGVTSITTILALSVGLTQIISHQVTELGGNIAVVRPSIGTTGGFTSPTEQTFSTSTLTENDYEAIAKIKDIDTAPIMTIGGSMHAKNTTVTNGIIVATTPSFQAITNVPIRDGQFIDTVTNRNTVVIGAQLSVDLFGTEKSVGHIFSIRGQKFTVIGIMKHINKPVNFNNIDLDHAAIMSLEAGKAFHQGIAQIQQIDIKAKDVHNLPDVISKVSAQLTKNHSGEHDFTVISGQEIATPTNQLYTAITAVITTIAAISLIVGGIGIMNIMLVGVAERTREIGLRKAVGASNGNIASQFLIEALIMSLIGGFFGYFAGYIIAFFISTFLTFDPAINWEIAAAAFGTSLLVGIVFGLYPALRAAQKDPIESLRQYH
jgi:putative ABC transport system permease protein